jgi:Asp-tRNA(Asn)/Glu-tRNA(Gln) amidotransferase A subunit family amidase
MTTQSTAGVLELLRLFKENPAAADQYAAACLEKAEAVEPVLKAFEYLPRDVQRRPGPLSGIPVGIKDIIATADMPTTNGSPVYKDCIPAADAWVVERLRNLGATIFGKTVSIGLGGGGRGRDRPAGFGHADAGLGDQAGGVQRRGRLQAQFRRDPAHRRAPLKFLARSCRLFRAARR